MFKFCNGNILIKKGILKKYLDFSRCCDDIVVLWGLYWC